MIPTTFAYERAESVEDAIRLLEAANGEAKLLAGGHSLLPLLKLRLTSTEKLIDIGHIASLRGVKKVEDRLVIGALTTHARVASHPLVREHLPALAEAASEIGDLQVRNRGTIGGNLAHADMASDLPAIALAFDAQFEVMTKDGSVVLGVDDWFLGPMMTALPAHSVLTSISFKLPPLGSKSVYHKFPHPASGYAVVGVAACASRDADGNVNFVRIALTGAGDLPFRARAAEDALLGQSPGPEALRAASMLAGDDGEMAGDLFASDEYRRHLCSVHARRALERVFA